MPGHIAIPKLGMAMIDATVVKWQVPEGGHASRGEVVVTIETEKTNWDVEAQDSGWLHILVPEDETVPVGRVIGLLAETESELAALQAKGTPVIMTTTPEPEDAPAAEPAPAAGTGKAGQPTGRGAVRVSPAARKIAEEHGVDLSTINPTGPDGRIVREDVERAIASRQAAAPAATPPVPVPATGETIEGKRVAATIPLKGMRRAIAEHMHRSLQVAAQLTYIGEADMSGTVALRKKLLAQEASLGFHATYTDLIIMAAARALRDVPILNSSIVGDEVKVWDDVNIGVAVALDQGIEGGLIVPVVRNVDQKPIRQVSRELAALIEKARAGRLLPDDVSGGTFTVTNLATVGAGWFVGTPIINQPQSAIVAIGPVSDRPVAVDGQVVIRPVMPYSLTYDHRVVDGAPAARFAARFAELLSEPALMLV
ncbi:MAG: 2-oxo acid dehydrogenase subunit E2 [Dehalococcoidia bacterium]|nr:2-oxo acid dehydrogenase subunit E2 [Dehalococcoidia bacterium]MCL4231242.1 2-oxo acid dehydrogenase subunit E2 [Dehalococcoidia bacterium]